MIIKYKLIKKFLSQFNSLKYASFGYVQTIYYAIQVLNASILTKNVFKTITLMDVVNKT